MLNYLFIFLYNIFMFFANNIQISYILSIFIASSFIIIFLEALVMDKKKSLLLIPILLMSMFGAVVSVVIFLIN